MKCIGLSVKKIILFCLLFVFNVKSMTFPFEEFSHLDRIHRPKEADVYDSLTTAERAYSKFLEHIDVAGTLINPMSRESKLFNEAIHRIINNPIGLELIKMIATKLERKKIVWEFILTKAEEIKRLQHDVNAEITRLTSHGSAANVEINKKRILQSKKFFKAIITT